MGRKCFSVTLVVVSLTFLAGIVHPNTGALAADSQDRAAEIQAREAFAAGRFEDALNRFAKLYAQTLHPVYLRNIGRCHQKMREPQKATDAFRDYLAKGKNIPAEERAEVEGYIKEMQVLADQQRLEQEQDKERERARRVVAAPDPAATGNSAGGTATVPAALSQPTQNAADINLAAGAGANEPDASAGDRPIYKRWWFWAAVGAVAVGTGATVFLLTREDCDAPGTLQCK